VIDQSQKMMVAASAMADMKVCAQRSTAADAIEDEVQEAFAICGGDMEFRSDSMFDEASTSQCNGGSHAWFKRD
jgi:hypothetical protein